MGWNACVTTTRVLIRFRRNRRMPTRLHRKQSQVVITTIAALMYTLLFVLLFFNVCNQDVAASFELCRLRRGFTIAQVEPFNANMTYGCEMTSDSNKEYHFFSSYESDNRNQTIDILLARESRQPKDDLRLFLVSHERIHWRVRADNQTTLELIRLSSPPDTPTATIEIDAATISLKTRIRHAKFFRGVWPSSGQFVELLQRSSNTIKRMEEAGHLRSFTAVWRCSNATIPVGVSEMLPWNVTYTVMTRDVRYVSSDNREHWKIDRSDVGNWSNPSTMSTPFPSSRSGSSSTSTSFSPSGRSSSTPFSSSGDSSTYNQSLLLPFLLLHLVSSQLL